MKTQPKMSAVPEADPSCPGLESRSCCSTCLTWSPHDSLPCCPTRTPAMGGSSRRPKRHRRTGTRRPLRQRPALQASCRGCASWVPAPKPQPPSAQVCSAHSSRSLQVPVTNPFSLPPSPGHRGLGMVSARPADRLQCPSLVPLTLLTPWE